MPNWEAQLKGFAGKTVTPDNPEYLDFCKAFNGNFHKRPAFILFPTNNDDVLQSIRFAKENNLKISVHNGGHSTIASGLNEGNLVLNMRDLSHINLSLENNTITVGAGALAHQIDDKTAPHGKAIPLGDCPVVGIAGLTLGGGIGFLSRSVGLTCDHLIEAKLITLQEDILVCNASQNTDLFHLLKGAGQGNFGIVTELRFRLVDIPKTVYGGNLCWHLKDAKNILRLYDELMQEAPNELNLYARINEEMGPMIKVYGMYNGDPKIGKTFFDKVRGWGTTIFDNANEYAYLDIQKINESTIVDSPCFLWKNGLIDNNISDHLIDCMLDAYALRPTPYCRINIDTLSGKVQEISQPSSFVHRNSNFIVSVMGVWFDQKDKSNCLAWANETMHKLRPYFNGSIYVNYADPSSVKQPEKYYGKVAPRITEMKEKLDRNQVLIGTLNPEKTEFS